MSKRKMVCSLLSNPKYSAWPFTAHQDWLKPLKPARQKCKVMPLQGRECNPFSHLLSLASSECDVVKRHQSS